jgi:hypothetical protein
MDGSEANPIGNGFGWSRSATPPNGARQVGKFRTLGSTNVSVAARYILVSICISTNSQPGCQYLKMVKANASGVYSHAWSIAAGIVTKITIGVYPDYPNISGTYTPPGGVGHPPHHFRITGPGNPIIMMGHEERTTSLTGAKTINVTLAASEVGNAFLTAAEVYAMHAAQTLPPSGSILADMNNVNIYANGTYQTNFAPLDSVVQLTPNTATYQPFTVAHELGHIVNWKSFNLTNAAYSTDAYTACFAGFGWGDTTDECEMVAWAEGFATMQAAMWM